MDHTRCNSLLLGNGRYYTNGQYKKYRSICEVNFYIFTGLKVWDQHGFCTATLGLAETGLSPHPSSSSLLLSSPELSDTKVLKPAIRTRLAPSAVQRIWHT